MIIASLTDITHGFGSQTVLEGVTWQIRAGDKIGLVGPNGAGKSTLLRLLAGEIAPDQGIAHRHKGLHVGYLAQEPVLELSQTAWQEMMGASEDLVRVESELRRLEARLAEPQVYGNDGMLQRVLEAHSRAQTDFERLDGYRFESRAREALQVLGLDGDELHLPVKALSGGQKKLIGLAKLLVRAPSSFDRESEHHNILLLDEPDNHLDLEGKTYLERFVASFRGTVIIVSHDRYLLDGAVTQIAEVEDRALTLYSGNYSAYAVEKQLRQLQQQRQYEAQQKEIARIEAAIARFEHWASIVVDERHARQARSRRKMLDRKESIDKPALERAQMGLELEGWRGSQKVLEIVDLHIGFAPAQGQDSQRSVLAGLNLLLWHGDRVGLLGPNGAGKTLLLKCILGQVEPMGGAIRIGPSVRTGYYSQEHETLSPERTLIDEIRQVRPMYEQQAVRHLGRFLFPYEMVRNRVRDLSGGERSRLQLAKLMLSDANFLLLDEPTNNLDLASCEVLENALDEFEGTVLIVSHDRYFLDRTINRVIELKGGSVSEYAGDYTYFAEQKARQ